MRIVLTGSIAYDYLMRFPGRFRDHLLPDHLDRISVSFLVEDMVRERGGNAANIAYSLALLGERPILMGTAGRDFGEYRVWLEERGVDTSAVRVIGDVYTASFFANTDSDNNQLGSFYSGAMAYSRGYTLGEALSEAPDLVVISPSDPTAMTEMADECRARGYPFLFDPSQQVIWLDGDSLRRGIDGCQILVVNAYEWQMIAKKTGLTLQELVRAGKTVIVTHGNDGSQIHAGGEQHAVPIFPVEKIADPTGVGDAYRAGLLKGIASGFDWPLSGRIAALVAAYTLEQRGTQNHRFTLVEFVARFRTVFDDRGALDAWLKG
jgi:adenosine kinase